MSEGRSTWGSEGQGEELQCILPTIGSQPKALSRGMIQPDEYLKMMIPALMLEKWLCRGPRTWPAGLVTGRQVWKEA